MYMYKVKSSLKRFALMEDMRREEMIKTLLKAIDIGVEYGLLFCEMSKSN